MSPVPPRSPGIEDDIRELRRQVDILMRQSGDAAGGDLTPDPAPAAGGTVVEWRATADVIISANTSYALFAADYGIVDETLASITNDDIKPEVAGWYLLAARALYWGSGSAENVRTAIAVANLNGDIFNGWGQYDGSTRNLSVDTEGICYMDGSTHSFAVAVRNFTAGSMNCYVEVDCILLVASDTGP